MHCFHLCPWGAGSSPLTRGKLGQRDLVDPEAGLIPAHAGKTPALVTMDEIWKGSSPLTRGKPLHGDVPSHCEGLIPAHAGKTRRRASPTGGRPAHPRSRGENVRPKLASTYLEGSSPLTRGKQARRSSGGNSPRLIPAHAGKTGRACPPRGGCRAHPRSRGENCTPGTSVPVTQGSSPLTRGKPCQASPPKRRHGLIPAHAGKTMPSVAAKATARAHPRSRGENSSLAMLPVYVAGSSPLTRGKPVLGTGTALAHGLIPAHAGKTGAMGAIGAVVGAHPRSRGENSKGRGRPTPSSGSSPLTRGKPGKLDILALLRRLIPAHAGKTTGPRRAASACPAHPRSRGENSTCGRSSTSWTGSSPLTRGKRQVVFYRRVATGLIPAHAGKT